MQHDNPIPLGKKDSSGVGKTFTTQLVRCRTIDNMINRLYRVNLFDVDTNLLESNFSACTAPFLDRTIRVRDGLLTSWLGTKSAIKLAADDVDLFELLEAYDFKEVSAMKFGRAMADNVLCGTNSNNLLWASGSLWKEFVCKCPSVYTDSDNFKCFLSHTYAWVLRKVPERSRAWCLNDEVWQVVYAVRAPTTPAGKDDEPTPEFVQYEGLIYFAEGGLAIDPTVPPFIPKEEMEVACYDAATALKVDVTEQAIDSASKYGNWDDIAINVLANGPLTTITELRLIGKFLPKVTKKYRDLAQALVALDEARQAYGRSCLQRHCKTGSTVSVMAAGDIVTVNADPFNLAIKPGVEGNTAFIETAARLFNKFRPGDVPLPGGSSSGYYEYLDVHTGEPVQGAYVSRGSNDAVNSGLLAGIEGGDFGHFFDMNGKLTLPIYYTHRRTSRSVAHIKMDTDSTGTFVALLSIPSDANSRNMVVGRHTLGGRIQVPVVAETISLVNQTPSCFVSAKVKNVPTRTESINWQVVFSQLKSGNIFDVDMSADEIYGGVVSWARTIMGETTFASEYGLSSMENMSIKEQVVKLIKATDEVLDRLITAQNEKGGDHD